MRALIKMLARGNGEGVGLDVLFPALCVPTCLVMSVRCGPGEQQSRLLWPLIYSASRGQSARLTRGHQTHCGCICRESNSSPGVT